MFRLKTLSTVAMMLAIGLTTQLKAQYSLSMSLEECLDYAKQNSITLQRAKVAVENNAADQLSAKGAFLPNISGSVGQNFNSNPLNMNPDATKSSYSGSYSVKLAMTLYSGGKNRSSLQQSKLGGDIANLELEEFENSIEVAVTEHYIEILYAMDQIAVAESSLEVSRKSEERGAAFLEAGSINEVDFAQLQSATATYEYNLINAKSQLSNLYVSLKHLLEISQNIELTVKEPTLSRELLLAQIPSVEEVYDTAIESRPEIISSKLYIESAELGAKIAKAGYLPTLSLSANTGLSHNTNNVFEINEQLRNNYNTSAGLNLSIPIFNGYKTKNSVTKANNSIRLAELSLSQAEKDLYKAIESLQNSAETSQAKYTVAELQLKATQKSLDLTTQQYELGMKNTIELLTEQNNYNKASQEFLMNKYQLILNKALLNYYKTNIIKL